MQKRCGARKKRKCKCSDARLYAARCWGGDRAPQATPTSLIGAFSNHTTLPHHCRLLQTCNRSGTGPQERVQGAHGSIKECWTIATLVWMLSSNVTLCQICRSWRWWFVGLVVGVFGFVVPRRGGRSVNEWRYQQRIVLDCWTAHPCGEWHMWLHIYLLLLRDEGSGEWWWLVLRHEWARRSRLRSGVSPGVNATCVSRVTARAQIQWAKSPTWTWRAALCSLCNVLTGQTDDDRHSIHPTQESCHASQTEICVIVVPAGLQHWSPLGEPECGENQPSGQTRLQQCRSTLPSMHMKDCTPFNHKKHPSNHLSSTSHSPKTTPVSTRSLPLGPKPPLTRPQLSWSATSRYLGRLRCCWGACCEALSSCPECRHPQQRITACLLGPACAHPLLDPSHPPNLPPNTLFHPHTAPRHHDRSARPLPQGTGTTPMPTPSAAPPSAAYCCCRPRRSWRSSRPPQPLPPRCCAPAAGPWSQPRGRAAAAPAQSTTRRRRAAASCCAGRGRRLPSRHLQLPPPSLEPRRRRRPLPLPPLPQPPWHQRCPSSPS